MSFNVYHSTKSALEKIGVPIAASPIVTSTNDQAKEEAFALSLPLKVYLGDQQTKGRGRGSNEWLNSAAGSALAITFSLDVVSSPQPITAPLVGLKVYESVVSALKIKTLSLKAPNDLLLGGKKVAGILVETLKTGNQYRLIIGLGMNVFSHPSEVLESTALGESVTEGAWTLFLSELTRAMKMAAHECVAPHFSDSERSTLLQALNLNPNLVQKFDSVSPFGDLIGPQGTLSWRDL